MPVPLVGKTSGLIQSGINRMDLILHLHITSLLLTLSSPSQLCQWVYYLVLSCPSCQLWATVSKHCVKWSYYLHKMYKRRHFVSIQHVIYDICVEMCAEQGREIQSQVVIADPWLCLQWTDGLRAVNLWSDHRRHTLIPNMNRLINCAFMPTQSKSGGLNSSIHVRRGLFFLAELKLLVKLWKRVFHHI